MPRTNAQRHNARRPSRVNFFWLSGLIILTAGFLNFTLSAARAASVFTVNSTGDGADSNTADNLCADGTGNCTLRAAVQQANATPGADTIGFSVTGTINLTGSLPDIIDNLTMNGPGSSLLTVRRHSGGDYRIFTIVNQVTIRDLNLNVSISGLTVADGRTADGDKDAFNGDSADSGGALKNGGTLTLNDVIFTGNSTGAGGPIFGQGGNGGAIFNFGALTMTNVTLPPSEQRVANFGHGEAGAADYEHLSFWVRDGRRAEIFYAYGKNWRAQNIGLAYLGRASCDGGPCFKVRFKNGRVFRIVLSDTSLRMVGGRGYDRQFRWSGGGEGGAVCDICAEDGGEAVKLLRSYFLQ